ncbi:homoserine kinase [compost metagenome]
MNSKAVQCIDNQYFLVYDWIDGVSLQSSQINNLHCDRIGAILADLHNTDFSALEIFYDHLDNLKETDWTLYLHKGQESGQEWVNLLNQYIEKLFIWSAKAKKSSETLADEKVISHRDLEPKNVIWFQGNPIIIDWESAGYINRTHDLIETAIYWSINEIGSIERERFLAFINGYQKQLGILCTDWRVVLEHGYLGKLDWLEYSLKRSLWIECTDENEQRWEHLKYQAH